MCTTTEDLNLVLFCGGFNSPIQKINCISVLSGVFTNIRRIDLQKMHTHHTNIHVTHKYEEELIWGDVCPVVQFVVIIVA